MRFGIWIFLFLIFFTTNSWAKIIYPFEGVFDFQQNSFLVSVDGPDKNVVEFSGKKIKDDQYALNLQVQHLKFSNLIISSHIRASVDITQNSQEEPGLSGKIFSKYTLVNFKPVREFSSRYEIRDHFLNLENFVFGSLSGKARVHLQDPFKSFLQLTVKALDLDSFLDLWLEEKKESYDALIYGNIRAEGDMNNVNVTGTLSSQFLTLGGRDFEFLQFSIAGNYPHVFVDNGRIVSEDGGQFSFKGPFDISSQNTYKQQVMAMNIRPVVTQSDSELEWTLKRVGQTDNAKTEIKYLKRKTSDVDIFPEEEEEGMFGLERVLEF